MTMIDQAAAAILAKVPDGYGMTALEARGYARAVMEVIREPTERMLGLADGYTDLVGYDQSCDSEWRREEFKIAWRVMIDEALGRSIVGA